MTSPPDITGVTAVTSSSATVAIKAVSDLVPAIKNVEQLPVEVRVPLVEGMVPEITEATENPSPPPP
jgi:hypothetical protein